LEVVKAARAATPHPPRFSRRRAILGGVIETERLVLRDWRASDRAPFAALNADREVMRHLGNGRPFDRAQSDAYLTHIGRHWREHGFGLWCAAPRSDPGAFLGFIGLSVPSFLPAVLPAVEVGWRLARPAWGTGLATEGARAALGHAFGELGLAGVVSVIDPANARSRRVAEKLGMRRGRDVLHPTRRRRVLVYEISSEHAASPPPPA
jgi:RimJ/RimL family protein N-acetyltransferase